MYLTISGGATTTGNAYFGSSVGIGAPAPKAPLHVRVTPTASILTALLLSNNAGAGGGAAIDFNSASADFSTYARINSVRTASANAPTDLVFSVSNTGSASLAEALRIQSTGNIGIGTSTPTANLQITAATANATTSVQFGKANQNKGTCRTEYDTAGSPVYIYIAAGATSYTFQNGGTPPAGCQN
jgi:hypothetical protein